METDLKDSSRSTLAVFTYRLIALLLLTAPASASDQASSAIDTLWPDLVVRASDLYINDIVGTVVPGHVHLRISNGTANRGAGPLYLYGTQPTDGNTQQAVSQRAFLSDGSYADRLAGSFIYHDTHGHIHFTGWSQFRIRKVLPGDSVGEILRSGNKTTFCILDEDIYDASLPAFDPDGFFFSCGLEQGGVVVQGLSFGWIDVYDKALPDQSIDITGIPPGEYWRESLITYLSPSSPMRLAGRCQADLRLFRDPEWITHDYPLGLWPEVRSSVRTSPHSQNPLAPNPIHS